MATAARRASLPLTERDLADLEKLRLQDSPWLRRVREHVGDESLNSEAAILHAVWRIGFDRLTQEVLDEGYAALAASYQTEDERAYQSALRRRSRRHHADRDAV
jgi:hypothetical protein